jgi:flagellar motor protein MotB
MARRAIAVTFVIVAFGKTPKSPAQVVGLGSYTPAPKNRDSQAEFLIYGEMGSNEKLNPWRV